LWLSVFLRLLSDSVAGDTAARAACRQDRIATGAGLRKGSGDVATAAASAKVGTAQTCPQLSPTSF
jgi:hypothetical protein